MDLDVAMRSAACPYTVHFYGALFREVRCILYLWIDNTNGKIFVLNSDRKRIWGPNK